MSTFPEYQWLPWKFNTVPVGFWEDLGNINNYMTWLSRQLNITKMEDWYKVSQQVGNLFVFNGNEFQGFYK